MNAEILSHLPTSGSYEEVKFDATDTCTWVKFEDSEYSEWIGVFGQGWGGKNAVSLNENGAAFVIALGQGYILKIDSRELIAKTRCDYLSGCIATTTNAFVANDGIRLRTYDGEKMLYCSQRVSMDGIVFTELKDGLIYGKVWAISDWADFSFDPMSNDYRCDWKCPFD